MKRLMTPQSAPHRAEAIWGKPVLAGGSGNTETGSPPKRARIGRNGEVPQVLGGNGWAIGRAGLRRVVLQARAGAGAGGRRSALVADTARRDRRLSKNWRLAGQGTVARRANRTGRVVLQRGFGNDARGRVQPHPSAFAPSGIAAL